MTGFHGGRVKSVNSLLKVLRPTYVCLFRDTIRVGPVTRRPEDGDSGAMLVAVGSHGGLGLGTLIADNADPCYFSRIPTANPGSGLLQQPEHPPGPF